MTASTCLLFLCRQEASNSQQEKQQPSQSIVSLSCINCTRLTARFAESMVLINWQFSVASANAHCCVSFVAPDLTHVTVEMRNLYDKVFIREPAIR